MRIRLTRRLAAYMDGIDVSRRRVGDLIDLSRRDAELLIAEGWAVRAKSERRRGDRRRVCKDIGHHAPDPKRRH